MSHVYKRFQHILLDNEDIFFLYKTQIFTDIFSIPIPDKLSKLHIMFYYYMDSTEYNFSSHCQKSF